MCYLVEVDLTLIYPTVYKVYLLYNNFHILYAHYMLVGIAVK